MHTRREEGAKFPGLCPWVQSGFRQPGIRTYIYFLFLLLRVFYSYAWQKNPHELNYILTFIFSENNLKRELPSPCLSVQVQLKNDLKDRSDTDDGVLTVITSHGPSPPEGATYEGGEGKLNPHHYYTARRSENPLTYPVASHLRPWQSFSDEKASINLNCRR
ncbi:hypothetical protein AVEN_118034-1 [Araneus ventricosus]|uniref:Uncharacterized protein n=1 Tax=Araneus ventricosus TaxID=182803 RepID=A0A4Y2C8D4_ARAVE|nr:hypothetical protein AVEN_118034-1 [Araneus ventricosus]